MIQWMLSRSTQTNRLTGGNGNDQIDAGSGDDVVNDSNGNDTILGGRGNDTVNDANGNDRIEGGAGNDTLNAGNGNDVFWAATATICFRATTATTG